MIMSEAYRPRTYDDANDRANQRSTNAEHYLKSNVNTFKAREGDNTVRFIPIPPAVIDEYGLKNHYGMEVFVHHNIGPEKSSFLCLLQMKKGNCPVCDYRAKLEAEKVPREE